MLFKRRFHAGLRDGSITLTFRAWSRPRVKPGGRYRCAPIGMLAVDEVEQVKLGDITDAAARRSGFADRDELIETLRKTSKKSLRRDSTVFRVKLHFAGEPSTADLPRVGVDLSAADVEALAARLEAMDRRSRHGPWTRRVLSIIERHPQVAASKLAPKLGRETQPFKADVRKLKKLGLTISHEVGYEISPRGRAYLESRPRR